MSESLSHALLPAGLPDMLPPQANHEAVLVERLMAVLIDHGYERVKPPLVEFEDSLLGGPGAALTKQIFRVMDPLSQRVMGIRPDITPQIARIATTRLAHAPRPLRLAYAGQVLRVNGSQLRGERELGQVGVELIGADQADADAEVIALATNSLVRLGITDLSVDLCVPTLVPTLCRAWNLSAETTARFRQALDRKDAAAVDALGGEPAAVLGRLMGAAGQASRALANLDALTLPPEADPDRRRLKEIVRLIGLAAPDLKLTVDLVEYRGLEYQTGVSFTVFSRSFGCELGSGGRYRFGNARDSQGNVGETATGFSLYTDALVRVAPLPASRPRLYLPHGTTPEHVACLRTCRDWVTVAGLAPVENTAAEARRLGCDYILVGTSPLALVP